MSFRGPLYNKVLSIRAALEDFRRLGVTLSGRQVEVICSALAVCAAEAEQMEAERGRLLEMLDAKIVSLSRHRRAHPPGGGDNGGTAA